jgi:very-short-patch-repair endonuclease
MRTLLARRLRQNRTDAERKLWSRLRRKQLEGARFRQQVPIGAYIVDFFCPEILLIVELDGGQHGSDEDRKRVSGSKLKVIGSSDSGTTMCCRIPMASY